jgi:uncharacterized damage-inducible protein DinB
MTQMENLQRLFRYDHWGNCEALASLKVSEGPPPHALRLMAHIVGCEWLWLARLQEEKKAVTVWPDLSVSQCETQLVDLQRFWFYYLEGLTPAQLAQPIVYVNSRGESWRNTVEDILLHVVMHSAYHRGQIALALRTAGETPAYTDYIHAVRQGFVE